jgi:hypothetical protein
MTLNDLATLACQKLGKSDPNTLALAKKFAQQRYLMIYDSALWLDSQMLLSFSIANDRFILPHYVDRIVAVRTNGNLNIPEAGLGTLFQADPTMFERVGSPVLYSDLPPVAVAALPAAPGTLTLVSNSASDTAVAVRVHGDLNGVQQRETVTLAGTAPVNTISSYDTPYILSKGASIGTVTITDSTANVIQTLLPDENERRHAYIRIHAAPDPVTGPTAILVLAKRKPKPLLNDLDVPTIRNVENALLAYTMADMLELLRQYAKAQLKAQEAGSFLAEARDLERNQGQNTIRIIPVDAGEWTRDDWSGSFSGGSSHSSV